MGLASSQHACTRTRGRDGRTDHTWPQPRALRESRRHDHAKTTAMQCESPHAGALHRSAASMPGQPSQPPAPLRHGSVGCRAGSSGQSGRSVGLVGKMRPARCPASPSQRPARPRAPWLHLLHLPWAEGRAAAVRDSERPPNALAAPASCLALQLVDKSPSPATRAQDARVVAPVAPSLEPAHP